MLKNDDDCILINDIIVYNYHSRINSMMSFLDVVKIEIPKPVKLWPEALVKEFPFCNREGKFLYWDTGTYTYSSDTVIAAAVNWPFRGMLVKHLYVRLSNKCKMKVQHLRKSSPIKSINFLIPKLYKLEFINIFPVIVDK